MCLILVLSVKNHKSVLIFFVIISTVCLGFSVEKAVQFLHLFFENMKKNIVDAINAQINAELVSAYTYLAMSAYLSSQNLSGAAAWMQAQSQEEVTHAMKFYNFLLERGGNIELKSLSAPKASYSSLLNVFEASLKQEQNVTKMIHSLYDLAVKEKDYPFQSFLQWFIDEQVEEESSVSAVIEKIKMIGSSGSSLYILDKELGERE